MSVFVSIGLVSLGVVLLVGGGELLLRGAVRLATLLRLTPAVIGLTVVAAGTSIPELAVSGIAAYQNKSDICIANVVGSNIFNISVIIGICALIRPVVIGGNTTQLEYPVLALVSLLCLVIMQDGNINRLDATLCLAVYVCFTAYLVSLVRRMATTEEKKDLKTEVQELSQDGAKPQLLRSLLLVAIGAALLGLGAEATVDGAVRLATLWGMSERVIGLTIVSVGTGLPEVVASVIASLRGRSDLAIGNVIGSNLFNILMILGISSMITPLSVPPEIIGHDGWWMLGITLLLFPIMYINLRVSRWEGVVLISAYLVYLGLVLSKPA